MVTNPGGVLIRTAASDIIGAAGISGGTSERDEACAIAGIEAAGLKADPGQDASWTGDADDFGLEAFDHTCYQES